jgi:ABC-type branched-subunit amino acid transport system ATPase component
MTSVLLEVNGLRKSFNGVTALADFSCLLGQGEILGVIGPNGAGKTTLFNVITGFLRPDGGYVRFKGKYLLGQPPHRVALAGIARTFQDLRLIRRVSVLENTMMMFPRQPGERLHNVFFRWKTCARREEEIKREALRILDCAGLIEKAHDRAEDLSYGQQKLLSLACCLASGADLLLLDEPVAGIAPEMMERILSLVLKLPAEGKSVVLIEHNMGAVMGVCDRVIFMDAGAKVSEGTPEEVRSDPRVIEAYLD